MGVSHTPYKSQLNEVMSFGTGDTNPIGKCETHGLPSHSLQNIYVSGGLVKDQLITLTT